MKKSILTVFIWIVALYITNAQAIHEDLRYVPETDPQVLEKLAHWQDVKFGLLMHWGAYSQWGIVESWSICAEDEGWCRRKGYDNYEQYKKDYENLITTFNPVDFAPEKWAKAAKDAGMKYMVFTTKHHDGFCMFDSKYTDYKITSDKCPFHVNKRANIAKEIFDAFREEDLMVGAYFSKPDWHCEYYWWPEFATPDRNVNYDPAAYPDRWEKYVEFTHNQIDELVTDYGKIDILWFDGGWVAKKSKELIQSAYMRRLVNSENGFIKAQVINQDVRMDEIAANARKKQPGLIVVDRAVHGKNQNYLTPENRVPDKTLPYPWESCIISGGGWSHTKDAKYMSGQKAIHMLVDIVAKGGNLLLNVAPGPDGKWQQGAYDLLKEYAGWMKVNSGAIYSTSAIYPYKEGKVCMTQNKDKSVNLIYMAGEDEVKPPSKIWVSTIQPAKGAKVSMYGVNGNLKWQRVGDGIVVEIPERIRKSPPCKYAWTIKVSNIEPGQ